jgi:hypothetical protein
MPLPVAAFDSVHETLRDSGTEHGAGSMGFLQARTANEVLKAQERKLRLQRLKGELIDRARATAQVFLEGELVRAIGTEDPPEG